MKKIVIPLILLVIFTLVLAACGGMSSASTNIKVTLTDFHFTPDTFTIPAGKEITVTAANNGAVEHEFVIFKHGTNPGDTFGPEDEENIYWEVQVKPGETKTVTFIAPADPGEYFLICGIDGHLQAGMSGKVVVVEK